MRRTLSFLEFETEYGTSEARRVLLQDLKQQLIQIGRIYTRSRILVFGSFVNQPSNPAPEDIDLIVSYGLDEGGIYRGPPQRISGRSIDLHRLDMVPADKPIPSLKQMVDIFNMRNAHKNIALEYDRCIEIVFHESTGST